MIEKNDFIKKYENVKTAKASRENDDVKIGFTEICAFQMNRIVAFMMGWITARIIKKILFN